MPSCTTVDSVNEITSDLHGRARKSRVVTGLGAEMDGRGRRAPKVFLRKNPRLEGATPVPKKRVALLPKSGASVTEKRGVLPKSEKRGVAEKRRPGRVIEKRACYRKAGVLPKSVAKLGASRHPKTADGGVVCGAQVGDQRSPAPGEARYSGERPRGAP